MKGIVALFLLCAGLPLIVTSAPTLRPSNAQGSSKASPTNNITHSAGYYNSDDYGNNRQRRGTCSLGDRPEMTGFDVSCDENTLLCGVSCQGNTVPDGDIISPFCDADTWVAGVGQCANVENGCPAAAVQVPSGFTAHCTGMVAHGEQCEIECPPGMATTSTKVTAPLCLNGNWIGGSGTCVSVEKECTGNTVPTISGLELECAATVPHGGTCTISCASGTIPNTSLRSPVCINGAWTAGSGVCVPSEEDCPGNTAPTISGLDIDCDTTVPHGGTCALSCADDEAIPSTKLRSPVCIDGAWTAGSGSCRNYNSCSSADLVSLPTGFVKECTGLAAHGASCKMSCPEGFATFGKITAPVCDDGSWIPGSGSCLTVSKSCDGGDAPIPTDFESECEGATVQHGETCEITCSEGKAINGQVQSPVCNDGTWEPGSGSCVSVTKSCNGALAPSFGGFSLQCTTQTIPHGEACEMTCAQDKATEGNVAAPLCVNGAWVAGTGKCVSDVQSCLASAAPIPNNLIRGCTGSVSHGSSCPISCPVNYAPSTSITGPVCLNSVWVPGSGECKAVTLSCEQSIVALLNIPTIQVIPALNCPNGGLRLDHGQSCPLVCEGDRSYSHSPLTHPTCINGAYTNPDGTLWSATSLVKTCYQPFYKLEWTNPPISLQTGTTIDISDPIIPNFQIVYREPSEFNAIGRNVANDINTPAKLRDISRVRSNDIQKENDRYVDATIKMFGLPTGLLWNEQTMRITGTPVEARETPFIVETLITDKFGVTQIGDPVSIRVVSTFDATPKLREGIEGIKLAEGKPADVTLQMNGGLPPFFVRKINDIDVTQYMVVNRTDPVVVYNPINGSLFGLPEGILVNPSDVEEVFHLLSGSPVVNESALTSDDFGNRVMIVEMRLDLEDSSSEPQKTSPTFSFELFPAFTLIGPPDFSVLDWPVGSNAPLAIGDLQAPFDFNTIDGFNDPSNNPVSFRLSPSFVDGFTIDCNSGVFSGSPNAIANGTYTLDFDLVATDSLGTEVRHSFAVTIGDDECIGQCDPGPLASEDGICKRGDDPFDQSFECDCAPVRNSLSTPELTVDDATCLVAEPSRASSDDTTTTAVFAALGCLALFAIIGFLYYRRKANVPHDFEAELDGMIAAGRIREDGTERHVPKELKRHHIKTLERVGGGAFGDVFKGLYRDPNNGIEYTVAIKQLKEDPSREEKDDLIKEATVTAQFKHENVMGLIGVVTAGAPMMLLMQYCEKGSLLAFVKKRKVNKPLDFVDKIQIGYSVCAGMEYLASKGFVHRDLAARNVLVDAAEVCKVADFGLSRDMEDQAYYRSEGGKVPIRWTAPEALEERRFSEKSDVWAYGILLQEVIRDGETPYRGWMNSYVHERVLQGYILPQDESCTTDFYYFIMKACWAFEPKERPTFAELLQRFRQIEDEDGGQLLQNVLGSDPVTKMSSLPRKKRSKGEMETMKSPLSSSSGGTEDSNGNSSSVDSKRYAKDPHNHNPTSYIPLIEGELEEAPPPLPMKENQKMVRRNSLVKTLVTQINAGESPTKAEDLEANLATADNGRMQALNAIPNPSANLSPYKQFDSEEEDEYDDVGGGDDMYDDVISNSAKPPPLPDDEEITGFDVDYEDPPEPPPRASLAEIEESDYEIPSGEPIDYETPVSPMSLQPIAEVGEEGNGDATSDTLNQTVVSTTDESAPMIASNEEKTSTLTKLGGMLKKFASKKATSSEKEEEDQPPTANPAMNETRVDDEIRGFSDSREHDHSDRNANETDDDSGDDDTDIVGRETSFKEEGIADVLAAIEESQKEDEPAKQKKKSKFGGLFKRNSRKTNKTTPFTLQREISEPGPGVAWNEEDGIDVGAATAQDSDAESLAGLPDLSSISNTKKTPMADGYEERNIVDAANTLREEDGKPPARDDNDDNMEQLDKEEQEEEESDPGEQPAALPGPPILPDDNDESEEEQENIPPVPVKTKLYDTNETGDVVIAPTDENEADKEEDEEEAEEDELPEAPNAVIQTGSMYAEPDEVNHGNATQDADLLLYGESADNTESVEDERKKTFYASMKEFSTDDVDEENPVVAADDDEELLPPPPPRSDSPDVEVYATDGGAPEYLSVEQNDLPKEGTLKGVDEMLEGFSSL